MEMKLNVLALTEYLLVDFQSHAIWSYLCMWSGMFSFLRPLERHIERYGFPILQYNEHDIPPFNSHRTTSKRTPQIP